MSESLVPGAVPPPAPLARRTLLAYVVWLAVALAYVVPAVDPVAEAHLALARGLVRGALAEPRPERLGAEPPGLALVARWPLSILDDLPGGHAPFESPDQLQAYLLALLLGVLPTACAGGAIASLLARRVDRAWALALGAFYALGTPAFAVAPRLSAAAFAGGLGACAFALAMPVGTRHDGSWTLSSGRAVVVGLLLGYAVSAEPLALPLAMVVVALLALRIDNATGLIGMGVAFALAMHPVAAFGAGALGTRGETTVAGPTGLATVPRLLLHAPLLLLLLPVAADHQGRVLRRRTPDDWVLGCWSLVILGGAMLLADLDHQPCGPSGPPLAAVYAPFAALLLHPLQGRWRTLALVLLGVSVGGTGYACVAGADTWSGLEGAWSLLPLGAWWLLGAAGIHRQRGLNTPAS